MATERGINCRAFLWRGSFGFCEFSGVLHLGSPLLWCQRYQNSGCVYKITS